MSRELRVNFQGVATIYGIIRKIGDDTVFNGSSFEAWVDGNIGNYDVPLTNRSGDLYSQDMPAAVTAGDYRITYYQQIAGAPATNDYIAGIPKELHWDGAAASSVSTVTLSPYALATLAQVKQDLGITDGVDDTALTEDINQVTSYIERLCKRKLVARTYRERIDGCQQSKIRLKQYPVVRLTRIAFGYAQAMSLSFTGSAIRANAAVYNDYSSDTSGGLLLVTISSTGIKTESNLPFTSYPSVSQLAAAVNAIAGWTASVISNQPTGDLNPTAVGNCLSRTNYFSYPDQVWDEYMMDLQAGLLQLQSQIAPVPLNLVESRTPLRAPSGFQSLLVEYRAGFETGAVELDLLNEVCREMVKVQYERRGVSSVTKSETVGPYQAAYDPAYREEIQERLSCAGLVDVSRGVA